MLWRRETWLGCADWSGGAGIDELGVGACGGVADEDSAEEIGEVGDGDRVGGHVEVLKEWRRGKRYSRVMGAGVSTKGCDLEGYGNMEAEVVEGKVGKR